MGERLDQLAGHGRPSAELSLRSDARHNRDRIIAAARAAFAEGGLDVPMREIARRAGVGIATLYRRFPTSRDLVTAVFEDRFATCMNEIDRALKHMRALWSLSYGLAEVG